MLQQQILLKKQRNIYHKHGIKTVTDSSFENSGNGKNYHPLEPVYLVTVNQDGTVADPVLVPAIYVKALAHLNEIADIMYDVRIGANIVAIIIGVATLGTTSTPLLLGLAWLDIIVTSADLLVIFNEDALMQTPLGKEFLNFWNNFVIALATPNAVLIAKNLLVKGTALLLKHPVQATRNFIITLMTKAILEINIANFTKGTVKVFKAKEVWSSNRILITANDLENAGAIFVKGNVTKGVTAVEEMAIVYKGEVLAKGSKRDIDKFLVSNRSNRGQKLVEWLEGLWLRKPKFSIFHQHFDGEIKIVKKKGKEILELHGAHNHHVIGTKIQIGKIRKPPVKSYHDLPNDIPFIANVELKYKNGIILKKNTSSFFSKNWSID